MLVGVHTASLAANPYHDSLKQVIQNHPADTIGLMAIVELTEGIRDSADVDYIEKGMALAEKLKRSFPGQSRRAQAELCINLGYYYYDALDEYDKAIEMTMPCLSLIEAVGDDFLTARAFNNISSFYFAKGDLNKSLSYAEKALELRQKAGHDEQVAQTLGNIGFLYFKSG